MITPGQYTADAIAQLNQTIADVDTSILYGQRNRTRRQYRSESQWSWGKVNGKLPAGALDASTGLWAVSLPSDFHGKWAPKIVGAYGEALTPTGFFELISNPTNRSLFAVDMRFKKLLFNGDPGTLPWSYDASDADLPADASSDGVTERFPTGEAVTLKLISYYWLASERASGKFDTFDQMYSDQLAADIAADGHFEAWVSAELPSLR